MKYKNDSPSSLKERHEGIVEVKLWEAFLLHNRNNIYSTLSTYAIENGPLANSPSEQSTVDFRFTSYDWNNTLKKMLNSYNIPVIKEKVVSKHETVLND
ncbi:MAG TPA: hypothetical protein VGD65_15475 [Chryseosolibacter sp.]